MVGFVLGFMSKLTTENPNSSKRLPTEWVPENKSNAQRFFRSPLFTSLMTVFCCSQKLGGVPIGFGPVFASRKNGEAKSVSFCETTEGIFSGANGETGKNSLAEVEFDCRSDESPEEKEDKEVAQ